MSDAGHHVLPLFSLQADLSRKSLPAVDVMELFGNILTGTSRTSVAANFCFPVSSSFFLPLHLSSPACFFKRLTEVIKDTERVHFVIMSSKLIIGGKVRWGAI